MFGSTNWRDLENSRARSTNPETALGMEQHMLSRATATRSSIACTIDSIISMYAGRRKHLRIDFRNLSTSDSKVDAISSKLDEAAENSSSVSTRRPYRNHANPKQEKKRKFLLVRVRTYLENEKKFHISLERIRCPSLSLFQERISLKSATNTKGSQRYTRKRKTTWRTTMRLVWVSVISDIIDRHFSRARRRCSSISATRVFDNSLNTRSTCLTRDSTSLDRKLTRRFLTKRRIKSRVSAVMAARDNKTKR